MCPYRSPKTRKGPTSLSLVSVECPVQSFPVWSQFDSSPGSPELDTSSTVLCLVHSTYTPDDDSPLSGSILVLPPRVLSASRSLMTTHSGPFWTGVVEGQTRRTLSQSKETQGEKTRRFTSIADGSVSTPSNLLCCACHRPQTIRRPFV